MKQVTLIKAEKRYIDSFYKLFNEVAAEGKWLGRLSAFPYEETVAFMDLGIQKGVPFLFAMDGDEVIGWCDVQPKEGGYGVFAMGLKLEYREQGIGRKMATEIIKLAKDYGYNRIDLEVRVLNVRAQNLYLSLGFIQTEYVKEGLTLNGKTYDYIKMSLEI